MRALRVICKRTRRYLLSLGARMDAVDVYGRSAVTDAAAQKHTHVVQQLLQHGAVLPGSQRPASQNRGIVATSPPQHASNAHSAPAEQAEQAAGVHSARHSRGFLSAELQSAVQDENIGRVYQLASSSSSSTTSGLANQPAPAANTARACSVGAPMLQAVDHDDRSLLHLAASTGSIRLCAELLSLGCAVNACDRWGATPLQVMRAFKM